MKTKPDHAMQAFLASRFPDGFHKDDPAHREIVAAEYPAYLSWRAEAKRQFKVFIDGHPAYESVLAAGARGELGDPDALKKTKESELTPAQREFLWTIGWFPRNPRSRGHIRAHPLIGSHRL